jgi:hypothetical protein
MMRLEHFVNPRLLLAVAVAALVTAQILSSVQLDVFSVKLDAPVGGGSNKKKVKLVQVMNAYSIPGPRHTRVAPFDQWSTIQSIQRAMKYAPSELEIDFVCAMFAHDMEALPELPCRKVLLHRSTKTEYPFFDKPKELPFIQDILDAAMENERRRGNDNFFVMLTNSDISLTKDFYPFVYQKMQTREAFSINRLTIPTNMVNETRDAEALLQQVDSVLDQGEEHPGYDCFIMHSSVLKRFRMGDLFAGHPPWGSLLMMTLRIMAYNYAPFQSNVHKTFHLGNDRSKWINNNNKTYSEIQNDMWFLDVCPLRSFGDHPYTILNTINCGKWFEYHGFYNNHTMPNFIQRGHEQMYLDRYPYSIRYAGPGGRGKALLSLKDGGKKQAALQKAAQKAARQTANSVSVGEAATNTSKTQVVSVTTGNRTFHEYFQAISKNASLARRAKAKAEIDKLREQRLGTRTVTRKERPKKTKP